MKWNLRSGGFLAPNWLVGKICVFQRCLVTGNWITSSCHELKRFIYFIDYVLIFSLDDSKENTLYPQKKKILSEIWCYALQQCIMAYLIGRTFWSGMVRDTALMLQISLCEFKYIRINSVVCVKVIRFTSSARTKVELEPPKSRKKPHKRCKRSSLYTL